MNMSNGDCDSNCDCEIIEEEVHDGGLDDNGLRNGRGKEKWYRQYNQQYEGKFFQDSLHGEGCFTFNFKGEQCTYEGQFYANNFEGYGCIKYASGNVFEGLFKCNNRFGPGIMTYSDGKQDVGLWENNYLIRLCCVVNHEWVPRLARQPKAKIKLLKYKTLVPICENITDRAQETLLNLNCNEEVLEQSEKLYNKYLRNHESLFFNRTLHDKNFFEAQDCMIDVALFPDEYVNFLDSKVDVIAETKSVAEEPITVTEVGQEAEYNGIKNEHDANNDLSAECIIKYQEEFERVDDLLMLFRQQIVTAQDEIDQFKCSSDEKPFSEHEQEAVQQTDENLVAESAKQFYEELEQKMNLLIQEAMLFIDDLINEEKYNPEAGDSEAKSATTMLLTPAINVERLLEEKKNDLIDKLGPHLKFTKSTGTTFRVPLTKKVYVTDLLAWNNELKSIQLLKHTFHHRQSEIDISMDVVKLLAGNRTFFNENGAYEMNCKKFLVSCCDGLDTKASTLLLESNINPDLCDAKGNTGIIYAAARDRVSVIKVLVNFGAKVDIVNDEALTPLNMCIARYLAIQNCVTDWENAFLSKIFVQPKEEEEVNEWHAHVSLASLVNYVKEERTVSLCTKSVEKNCAPVEEPSCQPSEQRQSLQFDFSLSTHGSNLFSFAGESMYAINEKLKEMQYHLDMEEFQKTYVPKESSTVEQNYILSTNCIRPPAEKKKKKEKTKKGKKSPKKDKSSKSSKKKSKSSKSADSEKSENATSDENKSKSSKSKKKLKQSTADICEANEVEATCDSPDKRLNVIYRTIMTLLKCGANPNIGEVPMPPLILAVFTKNISLIEDLLICKANPNITTIDENLTALHVVVSLRTCREYVEICKILIKYSANPDLRTNSYHWIEEKKGITGQVKNEVVDEGKTVLHLLCMRYDFTLDKNNYLAEMAQSLVTNGASLNDYYLGHTPLSLAILRGNILLIELLLNTKIVSPDQKLGENMGVPLTVLILKRYKDILPLETGQAIISLLMQYRANPLNKVQDIGNAIEFMNKEHYVEVKQKKKGAKDKKKGKGSKSKTASSKSSKSSKSAKSKKGKRKKQQTQDMLKDQLLQCARQTVLERVQSKAVKYLFEFVMDDDYGDELSRNLAKLLTPEKALESLQLLIHGGRIKTHKMYVYETCYFVLDFIIDVNNDPKTRKLTKQKINFDPEVMVDKIEFKKLPRIKFGINVPEPGLDREGSKYKVCFHCCCKENKLLILCPECQLVYFCSEECNKINNKQKNQHRCDTVFYNNEKKAMEERIKNGEPFEKPNKLLTKFNNNKELRLTRPPGALMEEKLKRIAEELLAEYNADEFGACKNYGDIKKLLSAKKAYDKAGQEFEKGEYELGSKNNKNKKTQSGSSDEYEKETGEGGARKGRGEKGSRASDESGKGGRRGSRASSTRGSETGGKRGTRAGGKSGKGGTRRSRASATRETKAGGKRGTDATDKRGISKQGGKSGSSRSASGSPDKYKTGGPFRSLSGSPGRTAKDGGYKYGQDDSRRFGSRLSNKCQYFMQRLMELFPDCNFSSRLFLPYACYADGQLYYRFSDKRPIFLETYSNV